MKYKAKKALVLVVVFLISIPLMSRCEILLTLVAGALSEMQYWEERDQLKKNRYIAENYSSWEEIPTSDYRSILLPKGWGIISEGNRYKMISEKGKVLGLGIPFHHTDEEDKLFFQEITGYESPEIDYKGWDWILVIEEKWGGALAKICCKEKGEEAESYFYYLQVCGDLVFVFPTDEENSDFSEELLQAIVFSTAYLTGAYSLS